jgi:formamidopyrimidine-DNA glycosylase
MPELPEVEVARLALEEHCVGKRIVRCAAADDTKVIDGVAPERLEASLVGRTIAAARRKGKNMWLVLDSPPHPTFQFGPSPFSCPQIVSVWFPYLTSRVGAYLVFEVFIVWS